MLANNRFVKFKCEKKNDNLKFTNDNIVNVLFYSEKNLLLSKGFSKDKRLEIFLKKILIFYSLKNLFIKKSFFSEKIKTFLCYS